MTSDQIKEVSLKHFAQNGYEGASLADIAKDVGIKKQSIYTHFKGKDELFLQICMDTFENELSSVVLFIDRNSALAINDFLYNFLVHCIERYEKYDSTKFMIRTAFYPPMHLNEQVMKYVYEYLDKVEELFLPMIERAISNGEISSAVGHNRATTAFMGVLDGIFVEMLYGGPDRLQKRLDASWYVLWRGLSMS
ncbi:TetR/AcrR family transcriptional regulator [Neobacillus niacini]|uniref:TetR/AcrR family transcriptional regulator n=1 Tax=Neobacillus niacini TaxID=86668 RepID=UPI001C8DD0D4|nr:TetR/AcrR family transcriptional regulator [Neobacillus niacini]MBY0149218.1 TetR/AcrR family transcriptional regulator [Neobacillus niacini]